MTMPADQIARSRMKGAIARISAGEVRGVPGVDTLHRPTKANPAHSQIEFDVGAPGRRPDQRTLFTEDEWRAATEVYLELARRARGVRLG